MEETVLLCKLAAHWHRSVGLACEDRDAVDELQRREEAEEVGLEMKRLVGQVACETDRDAEAESALCHKCRSRGLTWIAPDQDVVVLGLANLESPLDKMETR